MKSRQEKIKQVENGFLPEEFGKGDTMKSITKTIPRYYEGISFRAFRVSITLDYSIKGYIKNN